MNYKVFDGQYPNRLYMQNDLEVQFVNHYAEVDEKVAYKMSRYNYGEHLKLEHKIFPYNPDAWKKEKRFIWNCNMAVANGYGMVSENTIKTLLELGVNVKNPGTLSGNPISGGDMVDKSVFTAMDNWIEPDCIEVQHCQPPALSNNVVQRIWTYTMFETTHMPNSWIKMLNKTERVIVPSEWLVETWKNQGLKVPVSVIGHGVDPKVYYYLERPKRPVFRFLHYAQLSLRKGTDLVIKAFLETFGKDEPVELLIKSTTPFAWSTSDTPNIKYMFETLDKAQMTKFLQDADCLVFPTRGEGFGLPPLEAMATGMPTIVTGFSGPADYINKDDTLILDYDLIRAKEFDEIYKTFYTPSENAGYWAEPKFNQLKEYMRWVYENRDKAMEMGKKASERIAKDWTWQVRIQKLIDLLDKEA